MPIQNLYQQSTIQIYPNVISDYLKFFVRVGTRDPKFFNKAIEVILLISLNKIVGY